MRHKALIIFFSLISPIVLKGQSVLSNGNWFKMEIAERGMYRLTYQYLQNAGIPIDNINPTTIKIYGMSAGVLPQANNSGWPYDPQQLSIEVIGEEDGSFDANDYILFYAEDGDKYHFENNELIYEHNIYDDNNYYFLTYGGNTGNRIELEVSPSSSDGIITAFNDFRYLKEENYNLLTSGRNWYSYRFNTTTTQDYLFSFSNNVIGDSIRLTTNVMAQSFETSSFNVKVNNQLAGNIEVQNINDFNKKIYRYDTKGYENKGAYKAISNKDVKVTIEYNKNSSHSIGFLDDILLEANCDLSFNNDQLTFRSLESLKNNSTEYKISNSSASNRIWNITNKYSPKEISANVSGTVTSFKALSTELQEYVIFNPQEITEPLSISNIENQNIKSLTDSEFIIVTYPEFQSEAIRLANFRISNDGLKSNVVVIDKVYNEFSGGRQDVTAIRNMCKYLYDNGSLKYLLLFGRGSYDYKNTINNNTNFVPIYESRNSLHPLDTYASDDYYGFLEDEEGEWLEISGGNHSLDIGVGRLPIKSSDDARNVVDKIIYYSSSENTLGDWRNNVVLVADDGDFNLHQRQVIELTQFLDTTYSSFLSKQFLLDNFQQVSSPSGETSPDASNALDQKIEEGALIVNFTGHGGENGWMQEQILDIIQIQNWDNYDKLPLFVTATCEFGRHDDPLKTSGGEMIVTSENGAGIAIVSTCRPVNSSSNFALNKAFYENVYQRTSGEYLRLGDIFRLTKNQSIDLASDLNKVGNRNFSLLGDPTLRLNYPKQQVVITGINEPFAKTDTLKALSKVKLFGQVNKGPTIDASFIGEVSFTIFDKPILKTTRGSIENTPFSYYSKENIIFKGSSKVRNGIFDLEFVVPKNISYLVDNGLINLYAISDNKKDANGSEIKLKIGGTSTNPKIDNLPPKIQLFIGDTLNTNLSLVSHNTNLIAILEDESGINLSSFSVGNNITAILDETQIYNLNNYYTAFSNTYQKGFLNFPLKNLSKGQHTLKLQVWDTYNNSNESTISFTVADPNSVVIYDVDNYPNPFDDYTNFRLQHNKSGEDILIELELISPISGLVYNNSFTIKNSNSFVEFFQWNGKGLNGEKISPGIYIYQVTVRSIKDGAKNTAQKKLILIN